MRRLRQIDDWRVPSHLPVSRPYTGDPDSSGVFSVPSPDGARLAVIASTGNGWEHVSVSLSDRIPTWLEMDFIKRQFFRRDEVAVQFHVAESNHVNVHPNCLHLWRPLKKAMPLPPKDLV